MLLVGERSEAIASTILIAPVAQLSVVVTSTTRLRDHRVA